MTAGGKGEGTGNGDRHVLVAGGRVWSESGPMRADVLIEGGRIAAVGEALSPRGDAEVIDASDLDVLPGFIDIHVHAGDRIGPYELADSWASASEIALRNGITTLFGFVTQGPDETLGEAVDRCRARAAGAACEVRFHLTPTRWPWDWSEIETLIGRGFRTFKLYTTYREAGLFTPYDRLEGVMLRLAGLGGRLLVHCEDEETLAAASSGAVDYHDPFSHTLLRPPAAEVAAVRRVIELARRTGCPTHVVHVSTAEAAATVAAARAAGAPVSCETAPHYLLFDEGRLRAPDGHRFLCTPPLRDEATRRALERHALAGSFDLFATDHCAFFRRDKDRWSDDFRVVPNGLAGLGALVPSVWDLLVVRHRLPVGEMAARLAAGPARLTGLVPRKGTIRPGADADVVVIGHGTQPRPVTATLADSYNPFDDCTTTVDVRWVIRGGVVRIARGLDRPTVQGLDLHDR